ncbi:cupin-like domain-containing protein [Pseudomonas sp. S3_G06]
MTEISYVDRVAANIAYPDLYERYISRREPVVIVGAASGWAALSAWTPEFFVREYGDEFVELLRCGASERKTVPLREYFSIPKFDQHMWYLVDWDFRRRCRKLLKDIVALRHFHIDFLESIPPRNRLDLMWIYIGHAGTRGPTHLDNFGSSAWLAVVEGTKRLVFPRFHPNTSSRSRIDLFDAEDHPNVILRQEAILRPGDVAFVPAGCWHAALNQTYCVSVTANFVDGVSFDSHRAFATRHWFGREMLREQTNRIAEGCTGDEQNETRLHLRCALEAYQQWLADELDEVERLRVALGHEG